MSSPFVFWMGVAAVGLDLTPLPTGWGYLGPIPQGRRGVVAFSDSDCSVQMFVSDLDAGPYARDVRLARVWDGKGWAWADDWTLRNGVLSRPGRAEVPGTEVAERLEVDVQGRVIARVLDGRRVEILRGADGRFLGMRAGRASVELNDTGEVGTSTTGAKVVYTLTGTQVMATEGPSGRVRYDYDGSGLRSVLWPDGAALRIESDGTSGLGGRWRCKEAGGARTVEQDGDTRWRLEGGADSLRVEGPSGAAVRVERRAGALVGWTDPDGQRVEVVRADDGRVREVRRAGERVASLTYAQGELTALVDATGGRWSLSRDPAGVGARVEPDGRSVERDRAAEGRLRQWKRGSESASLGWDTLGRVAVLRSGLQGEARLERGAGGELVKVEDGAGGVWRIERESGGLPTALIDAAGTRWEVRVDAFGRLASVAGAGRRVSILWAADRRVQRVEGSARTSWLRDPSGRLSGVRGPDGLLWGFARGRSGELVSVRTPGGRSFSLGRDASGRLVSVGDWRLSRTASGQLSEVRRGTESFAGFTYDDAGRLLSVGAGATAFTLQRDARGRVAAVIPEEAPPIRLERDAAGRVTQATQGMHRTQLLRDSAGLVSKLSDGLSELGALRDLRGRVSKLTGSAEWSVGRDNLGRVVRQEVSGLGTVGADYEPGGALKLLRLADGSLVRRNASEDAGEVLATDPRGASIGTASWTLDVNGRVERVVAEGERVASRNEEGRLVRLVSGSEEWVLDATTMKLPDAGEVELDATGRPVRLVLGKPGPWGLAAGPAGYRWDEVGRLTGVDGPGGGAAVLHDALGRLVQLDVSDLTVPVEYDALGRLRRVAGRVLEGWDALLSVGGATRAPFAGAVARAGGAVLFDPRGWPLLVPWAGPLAPWPGGWVQGLAAAESGAGGRYVLPGGVLLSLTHAVDPVTGVATTPDRWPWALPDAELGPAASPFAAPDAANAAWWDPSAFGNAGRWSDPLAALVSAGVLPGGAPEPAEAPGLPWLPASVAPGVPAPLAGYGAVLLDEDVAGALVLGSALGLDRLDLDRIAEAFLAENAALDEVDVPGLPRLPGDNLAAPLANAPFGH